MSELTSTIKYIGKLVEEVKTSKATVLAKEEEIKELKARIKELEENVIPDVMTEAGAQQITLMSSEVVIVKPFYYARLPEDPTSFFEWLRKNEFGGLIKEKLELYPDGEKSQLLIDFMSEFGISYEQLSSIHWKTLEAWYKECCEAGVAGLPLDLFTNHRGRKATVK